MTHCSLSRLRASVRVSEGVDLQLSDTAMLDTFEILTTSGLVLWSRSYTPVSPNVINSLIKDVFIEEKVLAGATVTDDRSASRNPPYKKEQYTLRWTTAKDLGLIFVVRDVASVSAQ